MIDGDLEIQDLPGAWDEGMAELLGVTPQTDEDGCMQDIHWPSGAFGYFPTYTLGAVASAQIFSSAKAFDITNYEFLIPPNPLNLEYTLILINY